MKKYVNDSPLEYFLLTIAFEAKPPGHSHMTKKIKLIQIEPNLISFSDHYYNYSQYIKSASTERFIEYLCLCNRNANIDILDESILPILKYFSYNKNIFKIPLLPKSLNTIINNIYFSIDLFFKLRSFELKKDDYEIVFFATAIKPYQIWTFFWLSYFFNSNLSVCINTLELLTFSKRNKFSYLTVLFYRKTLDFLKYLLKKKNVNVFSDSELIKAELDQLLEMKSTKMISLLPIPGAKLKPRKTNVQLALNDPIDRAMKIVYLGSPRIEKGFVFLVDYIKNYLIAHSSVSFVVEVQINCSPKFSVREMQAVHQLIQVASDSEIVNIFKGPLNHFDYLNKLDQADIVVLPYNSDRYVFCTSGLLADALSMGKIAVVPRGTWMEFIVNKIGYGFTFERDDMMSFQSALFDAVEWVTANFNEDLRNVIIANWEQYNNTNTLIDKIVSN